MISIAMTSYNGEKYIQKQLDSLLNQTTKPHEVIIVDDYSTDSTVQIIKDYIYKHNLTTWKLILSEENKGYKHAFYEAIMKTKGDLIFLCDHDDVWLKNKIEIMSKIMDQNPNISALNSGFIKIDEEEKEIRTKNYTFSSNNNLIRRRIKKGDCVLIDLKSVLSYNISPGCTVAFRSVIKKKLHSFSEIKYNLVHDWKINIIAAADGKLYFLNVPTIKYRLHNNNTIGLKKSFNLEPRINEYEKLFEERGYLLNIIKTLYHNELKTKEGSNSSLNKAIAINDSLRETIIALKTKNIIKYLTLPLKYRTLRTRMIESWLLDIFILAKSMIFTKG